MVEAAELLAIVRQLDVRVILHAVRLCDGHGIVDPGVFVNVGLPEAVVEQLTVVHRSDFRRPKITIYRCGQTVDELKGTELPGVDGLDMLMFLAGALGVEYGYCFGRGSQVREIRRALDAHFAGVAQQQA